MKIVFAALALALAVAAEDFGDFGEYLKPPVTVNSITFTLFTRKHGDNGVRMFLNDVNSIKKAGFDPKLPTVAATHGYMANEERVQRLRKAFLARTDCNFISVDWSSYGTNALYEQVALSVKTVGTHVSKFFRFLRNETGYDLKGLHLIGHSLGAHVMSFASDEFPGEKVGRITGLDPAGPIFEKLPPQERLDPNDALFVDVIHTSTLFLGMRIPVGTVDFYPNGGNGQPGCSKYDFKCQHNIAPHYFAYTVRSGKNYEAVGCDSVNDAESGTCTGERAPMGIDSVTAKPGIYHVNITEAPECC